MRALARHRRQARRDRAIAAKLEVLSTDATERIRQLEDGTTSIARQYAALEDIAVGHEAAAQRLARCVLALATVYGDPLLTDPAVARDVQHYLPELGGPTRDHGDETEPASWR